MVFWALQLMSATQKQMLAANNSAIKRSIAYNFVLICFDIYLPGSNRDTNSWVGKGEAAFQQMVWFKRATPLRRLASTTTLIYGFPGEFTKLA